MDASNLLEDEQKKQAGGGVIAGSGGVASQGANQQPTGSGFTNLQTYLDANKGQGQGVAQDIVSEGQKGVDTARAAADKTANAWADQTSQKVNTAATEASNQVAQGNTGSVYGGPVNAQAAEGYNDIEKNYQNVKNQANSYANDYNAQKSTLQNKYGYGNGFGALDTFLGRQDGRQTIQDWQGKVDTGSTAQAAQKVNSAIQGGIGQVDKAKTDYKTAQDLKAAQEADHASRVEGVSTAAPLPTTPQAPTRQEATTATPFVTNAAGTAPASVLGIASQVYDTPEEAPKADPYAKALQWLKNHKF